MSGGHFDYKQWHIENIVDEIEDLICSNDDESINEWGDKRGKFYSEQTIKEFETAVRYLQLAYVYAQRVDWLVSGDDGEDSFHSRLKEELEYLRKE